MKLRQAGMFAAAMLLAAAAARADQSSAEAELPPRDFSRTLYVVETDSQSASDSLNRIAGDYDRGFATEDQSYDSPNHEPTSRFGTQGPSFEY